MLAGAELEPVTYGLVGCRTHLVGAPVCEHVLLAEGEAHVRSKELVRRADEHVDVPRLDVDAAVGRVVDGVRPREGADRMRELGDPAYVRSGAHRVRRDG